MELKYSDLTHMQLLAEEALQFHDLPKDIRNKISHLRGQFTNTEQNKPRCLSQEALEKLSVEIADEIQTFLEKDLPDEPENPNSNNMTKEEQEALNARAKAVNLPDGSTEADIKAAEEKKQALAARAVAVGLSEIATEAEVAAAEKTQQEQAEEKQKLIARAKAVGLSETATEAEIVAAENKPPVPKGKTKREQVEAFIAKDGRIYGDDLRRICPEIKDIVDAVEVEGLKLQRKIAFYYPA